MTSADPMPRRRLFRTGLALTTAAATQPLASTPASAATRNAEHVDLGAEFGDLERRYGARLGVHARNVRTGRTVAYRAGEPFAMCSTFKAFAAAAVLRDQGDCASLDKLIHYPPRDILDNSRQSEAHLATGMTVGQACAAAIQYSDNTAGNLLLRQIGGPQGLTRFFRSLGDRVSRLDRWETDLNTAVPGDPRDTSTPEALGRTFERLTLGRALARTDREQLVTWLKGNTTSAERFGAGLPRNWVLADKTGTGSYASANDVGVAWTTRQTPLLLTVLSTKNAKDAPVDNRLIRDAAAILAATLAPGE
ncbi:class A beta-lactamase [Streptomyces collinus]|uniref:class A beta-lactamase n=1 Tax=Streptomyces collinus TaxID=42684 RepID=UPI0036EEAEA4